MSFSHNPMGMLEVINNEDETAYRWHCNGCGGTSRKNYEPMTPLHVIRADYTQHIFQSHQRTRQDFRDWSTYWTESMNEPRNVTTDKP